MLPDVSRRILRTFCLPAAAALAVLLAGCGSGATPGPGAAVADSSAQEGETAVEQRTRALAQRLISQTDSAFEAVSYLSAAEKRQLRRYLQPQHIEQAQRLGLAPVSDRRRAAGLEGQAPESGGAVRLSTNAFYIVDPSMSYAVPLVIPATGHLLERLGRRFQTDLLEQELPPYRFVLTNILRTGQDQAALRGGNVNAARGQSTHEYGTTFDIFYGWFHYAAVHDTRPARPSASLEADSARAPSDSVRPASAALTNGEAAADEASIDEQQLRQMLYAAYVRFGRERARKIKAVLGRTILAMQEDGLVLATYERRQPVFHLTVAREVEPPARPFSPPRPDSTHRSTPSG